MSPIVALLHMASSYRFFGYSQFKPKDASKVKRFLHFSLGLCVIIRYNAHRGDL